MTKKISEIKKELIKRELGSRKLKHFTEYTKSDYEMIATQGGVGIHQQIIDKLEAVERGEIKRLMIFVRPRIGKSELASLRFPSWILGRDPTKKVVVASYGADLASDFGRKARSIVKDKYFKNIFPEFELSKDKAEGSNWETSKGGGLYTVGVGGALTGKGFDIGIIDDPVKDRQDAESQTVQKRIIDWYSSTFYTRRQNQDSAIILMMTRWNKNDLAGYLLNEAKNGGDQWDVLVIPAINEHGESIVWPGKWDEGYIEKEKANVTAKDWSALYQQDPIASASNIFNLSDLRYFLMSDFERVDGILKKKDVKNIIYVDPAFSTNKNSDDAVAMAVGKHKISGDYYSLDMYADTSAPSKTYKAILAMYDRVEMDGFKIDSIYIEDVALNKQQTDFIKGFKTFLKENNRYITVNKHKPVGKKEDRIKFTLEPKVALNAIHLRKDFIDKQLINKLETQIGDFPYAKHDDMIDCLNGAVTVLDKSSSRDEEEHQEVIEMDIDDCF